MRELRYTYELDYVQEGEEFTYLGDRYVKYMGEAVPMFEEEDILGDWDDVD